MKYENLLSTTTYLVSDLLPPISLHSASLFILTLKCFEKEDFRFQSQLLNSIVGIPGKAIFKYM